MGSAFQVVSHFRVGDGFGYSWSGFFPSISRPKADVMKKYAGNLFFAERSVFLIRGDYFGPAAQIGQFVDLFLDAFDFIFLY